MEEEIKAGQRWKFRRQVVDVEKLEDDDVVCREVGFENKLRIRKGYFLHHYKRVMPPAEKIPKYTSPSIPTFDSNIIKHARENKLGMVRVGLDAQFLDGFGLGFVGLTMVAGLRHMRLILDTLTAAKEKRRTATEEFLLQLTYATNVHSANDLYSVINAGQPRERVTRDQAEKYYALLKGLYELGPAHGDIAHSERADA